MNTESKTPRTDDQSVRYYDDATGTRIEYVAARFARQLERELTAVAEQRDSLRELHNKNAMHSKELLELCGTLRKERDEVQEQLRKAQVENDHNWQAIEMYEAERALADRLAKVIQVVMIEERDLPVASCKGFIDFDQAILALTKWKEARHES